MTKKIHIFLTLSLLTLTLVACGAKRVVRSGFLGDQRSYRQMQKDTDLDMYVWRSKDNVLSDYNKIILPPVQVYLNKEGLKRGVSGSKLEELAQHFRKSIVEALGDKYQIASSPSPDAVILRLAITDADPNIQALNIHPGTVISGIGLGGATMEAEFVDSKSFNRVATVLAASDGVRYQYHRGLTKWGHTKGLFNDWAALLRERLDSTRG